MPFAPLPRRAGTAWVATGDLNGDGIPDVVIANRVDDTVSVFLGTGDGTFLPPKTYAIGAAGVAGHAWPTRPATESSTSSPPTRVPTRSASCWNNGDGTFQPQIVIPVGTRPGGVTVADVNGDGTPDLIVSNYADDTIWVMLGEGNGTFQAPEIYPTDQGPGFAGPGRSAVADVTGDGIPDLIYPDYVGGNVAVRLGNGNGTFGPEQTFPAGKGRLFGRGGGSQWRRQARPRRRQRRGRYRERAAGQRQRHVPDRRKSIPSA